MMKMRERNGELKDGNHGNFNSLGSLLFIIKRHFESFQGSFGLKFYLSVLMQNEKGVGCGWS